MADAVLEYIKEAVDRIESKQDKLREDHDLRLRSVENWQSDAMGRMSILGAVSAAVGGFIVATIEYLRGHQ